jgi:hypothetical protein
MYHVAIWIQRQVKSTLEQTIKAQRGRNMENYEMEDTEGLGKGGH